MPTPPESSSYSEHPREMLSGREQQNCIKSASKLKKDAKGG